MVHRPQHMHAVLVRLLLFGVENTEPQHRMQISRIQTFT